MNLNPYLRKKYYNERNKKVIKQVINNIKLNRFDLRIKKGINRRIEHLIVNKNSL